jgi:hypothetical protein
MSACGRSETDEHAMRTSAIGKPNVLFEDSVIPDGRDSLSDGRGCAHSGHPPATGRSLPVELRSRPAAFSKPDDSA